MRLHFPWSRHYRAYKHTGSKYWSWTHSLESTPHPWLILGLVPPAPYHAFFSACPGLNPRSKKMPCWDQCLGTSHAAESLQRSCWWAQQPGSRERLQRGATQTARPEKRFPTPHSLPAFLGRLPSSGWSVPLLLILLQRERRSALLVSKIHIPRFFFFFNSLWPHKVGGPASAKKGTQEKIGISFQLLLFPDFFKDKTMIEQWLCAYLENTSAFL